MWKCKQCGKQNQPNRDHCWHCGSKEDGTPPENPERFLLPSETIQFKDNVVVGESQSVDDITASTICYKCAASLDADAKFCPSCRTPVSGSSTLSCPSCGKPVSAGAKFCKYCAADLTKKEENKFAPRDNYSHHDSFLSIQREKAERLAKAGGITAGISALLFLWGYGYTSSFAHSARAGLMNLAGQTDSTYQIASLCVFLGSIGFLVGLILFIVGMAQRSS